MSDLGKRLAELDSGDQYAATMALPDHLRDALWRFSSAKIDPIESTGLVVCGMGGSAIGGDLAAAAIGGRLGAAPRCRAWIRRAALDPARPRDLLLELLRQHRGDNGLLRGRRGGRRAPRRRHHRRRARRCGPPRQGSGDRHARRAAAPRGGRLHLRSRRRGRRDGGLRPGDPHGDRQLGRPHRGSQGLAAGQGRASSPSRSRARCRSSTAAA